MKVIPIHYTASVPVTNWLAIESDAKEMAELLDREYENTSVALHHCQVSEKPFNFFVVNPKYIKEAVMELGSRYIVNPHIVATEENSLVPLKEGCLSFPLLKPRNVMRYLLCIVEFGIPDPSQPNGLAHKKVEVNRLIAQMFQHECQHAEGKNIRWASPKKKTYEQ